VAAYVNHRFSRGFRLGEEQLRKLNDIISKRVDEIAPGTELGFTVRRADSYEYRTPDIDVVCQDENRPARRIIEILLKASSEDTLDLDLKFDRQGGARLAISGADRDKTYLLFSDIKTYMDSEVARTFKLSDNALQAVAIVLLPVLFIVGLVLMVSTTYDTGNVDAVLKSTDIAEKLNYLIGQRKQSSAKVPFLMLGAIALPSLAILFGNKLLRFVLQYDEFLLGKRGEQLAVRQRTLSNVFWVIVVSGILIPGIWYLVGHR
jgi:hypothetical protein